MCLLRMIVHSHIIAWGFPYCIMLHVTLAERQEKPCHAENAPDTQADTSTPSQNKNYVGYLAQPKMMIKQRNTPTQPSIHSSPCHSHTQATPWTLRLKHATPKHQSLFSEQLPPHSLPPMAVRLSPAYEDPLQIRFPCPV